MKFPGSRLLHQVDLSITGVTLSDVLRSCQQVALTGFAEVRFAEAMGMIFYYLGGEVNALYREGPVAHNGQAAIERLKEQVSGQDATVAVYELPLDMAHMLRGITQRRKLKESLRSSSDLETLLASLAESGHTGTLEIQTESGAAMLLLVQGRVSNVYWETQDGLTFEKGEARRRLDRALAGGVKDLLLSDFSREIWKARHEIQASVHSRLQRGKVDPPAGTEQLASEESEGRTQLLEELSVEVPALLMASLFDMLTGSILCRKVRGTQSLRVGVLAERIPSFLLFLKDLVAAQDDDRVELVTISTERVLCVVAVIPRTQEAVAVLADKAQPTALIESGLNRAIQSYLARLRPTREVRARADS